MTAMETEGWRPILEGIRADPANDLRRLVAADYLEENGDAEYGEFVRLSVEWEAVKSKSRSRLQRKKRATLFLRLRKLFVAVAERDGMYRAVVPPMSSDAALRSAGWRANTLNVTLDWRRGFVEAAEVPPDRWADPTCRSCSGRGTVLPIDLGDPRKTPAPEACEFCRRGEVLPVGVGLVRSHPIGRVMPIGLPSGHIGYLSDPRVAEGWGRNAIAWAVKQAQELA